MRTKVYFIISLLALAALSVSCSHADSELSQVENRSCDVASTTRSVEDAREIAIQAYSCFKPTASRAVTSTNNPCVLGLGLSSRGEAADTLLYVFNYEDAGGYAIVSAATEGIPVLAFVEEGSFNQEETYNTGFEMFLNQSKAYVAQQKIASAQLDPTNPFRRTKIEYEWKIKQEVKPKIEVKWGRHNYEGAFCPNGDAGVEAIALAQILSYYERPSFVYDYSDEGVSSGSTGMALDWSDLKNHKMCYHDTKYTEGDMFTFLSCPASEKSHAGLGLLCREIGEKCNTDYFESGTVIEPITMIDCLAAYLGNIDFELFIYSILDEEEKDNYEQDFIEDNYLKQIIEEGFVLLQASDKNDIRKYYTWIADGYRQADIYANEFRSIPNDGTYYGTKWELIASNKIKEGLFVHYNWCSNGQCNGYFSSRVINPRLSDGYDTKLQTWEEDFNFVGELLTACLKISKK